MRKFLSYFCDGDHRVEMDVDGDDEKAESVEVRKRAFDGDVITQL
jgi:hypothetical protein